MIPSPLLRTLTRLSLVCLFPPSALDKIINRGEAMRQAESGPLPYPGLLLDLGIAVETIAPVLIVAEKRDREAAAVLAGFCAVTALLYHRFWTFDDLTTRDGKSEGREHLWEFLKNFGLAGGLMMVALEDRPSHPSPVPPVAGRAGAMPPRRRTAGAGAARDGRHGTAL